MKRISKSDCRKLSDLISNEDIDEMLMRAIREVPDWKVPSRANPRMSRGIHWNMFCKDYDPKLYQAPVIKYRLLEEYGEYLREDLKPTSKKKQLKEIKATHQEPIFDNFKDRMKDD